MVNGYTAICLTKLDILDTLPEIKIGKGWVLQLAISSLQTLIISFLLSRYKLDGKIIEHFPGSISDLANVEVEFETLPGWQTSIASVRDFKELPEKAQNYVRFIENYLNIPIKWIGVGKGRESIITVN